MVVDNPSRKQRAERSKPTHAVILAAGYGSRLDPDVGHKILVDIDGRTMLDRHLENFSRLGVRDVTVVTGYDREALERELAGWEVPEGMQLRTSYNEQFDLGNGISVLEGMYGAPLSDESSTPCWLTMSDHIFEPVLFEQLAEQKPWTRWRRDDVGGALLVDRKLESVYDMPDANKVQFDSETPLEGPSISGRHLEGIGKDLDDFQAVDVGLFWCDSSFGRALQSERRESGDCWTNDAVTRLSQRDDFQFWGLGDVRWCDVDTPEDRRFAEELADEFRA